MPSNSRRQSTPSTSVDLGDRRAAPGLRADSLRREFQDIFGLNLYEARVLLAVLQLGSANSASIARVAQLPRTSTYPVMEALEERGLVQRRPGDGVIEWTTPGIETVIDRLDAAAEDTREAETRQYRERSRLLRTAVASAFPSIPADALSDVQVIRGSARVKKLYEQMLSGATSDLQMFTRPPYAAPAGYVNPAVMAMLARGIRTRVVYQLGHQDHTEFGVYHEAGVQARVVDTLPLKLAIVDRRASLVGMPDLIEPEGYPTTLFVEHPAYALLLSMAFDHVWAMGRPYQPPGDSVDAAELSSPHVTTGRRRGSGRGPAAAASRSTRKQPRAEDS